MNNRRPLFILIRLIVSPFILLYKFMKLASNDCFITLKRAMLRSHYWEERILLITTIILIGPILWTTIPVLGIIFLSTYWAWGFGLTVPFILSWAFALYYVNHEDSGYSSKRFKIEDEVPWAEIRWGSDFFPKDEVISMLKDEHSCAKCRWSGQTGQICVLNEKFATCHSWQDDRNF